MLRQAENKVRIEGILAETDLKYGSYVNKSGETVETIGGQIKILVDQELNGKAETIEVPVHLFSGKYTRAGKVNPAYESIEKVMKEFVSIAACGSKEQADKVRITSGSVRINEFFGQNDQLVSTPRISASFVSKAVGDFKPEASFSLEFVVSNMNRVVDRDGVEVDPAKLEITTIVPQYGGKVDIVKLYATNPNVINAIENYWEMNNSYRAIGKLNFTSTTREVTEQLGFGEPVVKVRTINVNELIITGGSEAALDDSMAFGLDDIRAALAERKARLEESKAKSTKKAPAPASSKGMLDLGF